MMKQGLIRTADVADFQDVLSVGGDGVREARVGCDGGIVIAKKQFLAGSVEEAHQGIEA